MSTGTREFFCTYPTYDRGHKKIGQIPEAMALSMVASSPYFKDLRRDVHIFVDIDDGSLTGIMNKGAIRVTPSWLKLQDMFNNYEEAISSWKHYFASRPQLWVYNHDGRYYITQVINKED